MPDSVSIVRMVEQRAYFAGWLNMKVQSNHTVYTNGSCCSSGAAVLLPHKGAGSGVHSPPDWTHPWCWLQVLKFAGFRRVWEQRYCLITPRRHNQRTHPDNGATFTLLTWFRAQNDFNVCGKVRATSAVCYQLGGLHAGHDQLLYSAAC